MAHPRSQPEEQCQRIEVELARGAFEKSVKIRVESFDEKLGWYTARSLSLPLHLLPLLEQAIADMRAFEASDEAAKIIPFPEAP